MSIARYLECSSNRVNTSSLTVRFLLRARNRESKLRFVLLCALASRSRSSSIIFFKKLCQSRICCFLVRESRYFSTSIVNGRGGLDKTKSNSATPVDVCTCVLYAYVNAPVCKSQFVRRSPTYFFKPGNSVRLNRSDWPFI